MFNVYKNSFKEGFVVVVVLRSSQLPEQKEGLFSRAKIFLVKIIFSVRFKTSPPSAREAATTDIQQQQNKLSLKDY